MVKWCLCAEAHQNWSATRLISCQEWWDLWCRGNEEGKSCWRPLSGTAVAQPRLCQHLVVLRVLLFLACGAVLRSKGSLQCDRSWLQKSLLISSSAHRTICEEEREWRKQGSSSQLSSPYCFSVKAHLILYSSAFPRPVLIDQPNGGSLPSLLRFIFVWFTEDLNKLWAL